MNSEIVRTYYPNDADIADVFRKAVENLKTYGWVQGAFGHRDIGYCAFGAIKRAAGCNHPILELLTVRRFIRWMFENGFADRLDTIARWNDKPGRTKDEVILYMTKCADGIDPSTISS